MSVTICSTAIDILFVLYAEFRIPDSHFPTEIPWKLEWTWCRSGTAMGIATWEMGRNWNFKKIISIHYTMCVLKLVPCSVQFLHTMYALSFELPIMRWGNGSTETARHGIGGTKMQGWKLRHKRLWTAQTTLYCNYGGILCCSVLSCWSACIGCFWTFSISCGIFFHTLCMPYSTIN